MKREYEVAPRAAELGGGWNLKLLDEAGQEAGGGAFPLEAFTDEARALAEDDPGSRTIAEIARDLALDAAIQEGCDYAGEEYDP